MGFPGRSTFRRYCPSGPRTNRMRVTNAVQEKHADIDNDVFWQSAGLQRTCSIATLTVDANGEKTAGGEAWNDQDEPGKRIVIGHDATGVYQFQAPSATAPDWEGTEHPIVFTGAQITLQGSAARSCSYTIDTGNPTAQITVYLFNASNAAFNAAFTIDIK